MAPSESPLKLSDEIQRDTRTILFRGTYGADSQPVRVRVPVLRQARDIAAIHREHDMLARFGSARLVRINVTMMLGNRARGVSEGLREDGASRRRDAGGLRCICRSCRVAARNAVPHC